MNGLNHNLISISQLCDANFKVLFTKTQGTIFNQRNEVVLIAPRNRDVYVIDMSSYNKESNSCFFAKASRSVNWLWHKRLSHLNFKNINKLARQNLIMENLNEVRVKELRSDNGTEFRNHKLKEFCDEKGISQNFSSLVPLNNMVGRSPDINYFHVFGCLMNIHNHKDHMEKFDEKAGDEFFPGYSLVAKAFNVFNIRRQEMEETYHVTFSENDEEISKSSLKGDEINFNENRSFPMMNYVVLQNHLLRGVLVDQRNKE
ncbi:retrovirus-related pol polyprotein from transposon TNT 1-94 [Tanacetum coccineum]